MKDLAQPANSSTHVFKKYKNPCADHTYYDRECLSCIDVNYQPAVVEPALSPEAAEIVSVLAEPSPKQTDIAKLQAAMNARDIEAIKVALFGKPTGIAIVDNAIADIMAQVELLQPFCFCGEFADLAECRLCHNYVCRSCRRDHVCGSGPDAGQGRF